MVPGGPMGARGWSGSETLVGKFRLPSRYFKGYRGLPTEFAGASPQSERCAVARPRMIKDVGLNRFAVVL
jgi:hypothetical protein